MEKKDNFITYILMHFGFLIYSCYSLVGKYSSKVELFSLTFFVLYALVVFILFVYAIIWQQVLKSIRLSTAIANKSVTIIWGMFFGRIFFNETITIKNIIGAVIILAGILLLSLEEKYE